jgi:hypothetical protein
MWAVTEQSDEYVVIDHNGTERARFAADGGISTGDVREAMHDRAGGLKEEAQTAAQNGQAAAAIIALVEWMTVVEDMAGDQIELPHPEQ